jgi:hypothetical protein
MVSEVKSLTWSSALRLDASNLEEEWRFWEQKFDLFITASGASEKPEPTQIAICCYTLSVTMS